jgi:hypothetical protein
MYTPRPDEELRDEVVELIVSCEKQRERRTLIML